MLSRWFFREGLSQILAPDENAPKPEDEARSAVWQFLAPDPKFAPPKAPPPVAFRNATNGSLEKVQCQHCHKWTPVVSSSTAAPATPEDSKFRPPRTPANGHSSARKAFGTPFMTPSPSYKPSEYGRATGMAEHVEALVLSGVKATAMSKFSPKPVQQKTDKIFRFCTSTRMNDGLANRLTSLLEKNPSLLHARARDLGQLAPDGFTPIMASAKAGATRAASILVDFAMSNKSSNSSETSVFEERDTEGRTAIHIAAEFGHYEIVNLLLPGYLAAGANVSTAILTSPMPLDLMGRTPLGSALTSPHPSAKKMQKQLKAELFSPRDLSIIGVARPEADRMAFDEAARLSFGVGDMPGLRVDMEDAVCSLRFECKGKPYWLFAVCDGHGDQGNVSDFVATQVPMALQAHMAASAEDYDWNDIWKTTCLQVDQKLQQADLSGGSTAVFALVGPDVIVVANVGDSRAILVQSSAPSTTTGLEQSMEKMAIEDKSTAEGQPAAMDTEQAAPGESRDTASSGPIVTALSEDHKPNLPEEQARIEKAGMKVVPITFEEEGQQITIHKVAKTDNDMLAVSRSFGDFEYKANTTLPPEEQAVTALPEVRIHTRNPDTDLYLVLACDGIWDVCDNDFVKDFVLEQVAARRDASETVLPEVVDALLRESLNRGSQDNMTTILVALESSSQKLLLLKPIMEGKALDFASVVEE